ncbi:MAG: DUF192 domain-containing protein [Candidatus Micrarchaeota archaeon]|nr:DUF192 domain-containing protein [Candidatus Micrarchaeota archaeon]
MAFKFIFLGILIIILFAGCLKKNIEDQEKMELTYEDFKTNATIYFLECNKKIFAKVADESWEQQIGFQRAKKIEENQGILFVFDKQEKRSFWMKDVEFDLDIIFLDENKKVVDFFTMERCLNEECKIYTSAKAAKYALEVKKGVLKGCVYIGQKIKIELFEEYTG